MDDPVVRRIVDGWSGKFDASRAERLGFKADADFDTIVCIFIDEQFGRIAV